MGYGVNVYYTQYIIRIEMAIVHNRLEKSTAQPIVHRKNLLQQLMASSEFSDSDLESFSVPMVRELVFRLASLLLLFSIAVAATFIWHRGLRTLAEVELLLIGVLAVSTYLLLAKNIRILSPLRLIVAAAGLLVATVLSGVHAFIYFFFVFPVAFYLLVDTRQSLYLNLIWFVTASSLALAILPTFQAISYMLGHASACFLMEILLLILGRSEEQLKQLAIRDPLTNAFNRRAMNEVMEYTLMMHERYNFVSSIIMIDIDGFKKINDSFGHKEGDVVLKKLVAIVSGRLRGTDKICRYGGEEFVVIFTNTTRDEAFRTANAIREQIRTTILTSKTQVTVSCGVAESKVGDTVNEWLHRCDMALYRAKHNGRDRVELEEVA